MPANYYLAIVLCFSFCCEAFAAAWMMPAGQSAFIYTQASMNEERNIGGHTVPRNGQYRNIYIEHGLTDDLTVSAHYLDKQDRLGGYQGTDNGYYIGLRGDAERAAIGLIPGILFRAINLTLDGVLSRERVSSYELGYFSRARQSAARVYQGGELQFAIADKFAWNSGAVELELVQWLAGGSDYRRAMTLFETRLKLKGVTLGTGYSYENERTGEDRARYFGRYWLASVPLPGFAAELVPRIERKRLSRTQITETHNSIAVIVRF